VASGNASVGPRSSTVSERDLRPEEALVVRFYTRKAKKELLVNTQPESREVADEQLEEIITRPNISAPRACRSSQATRDVTS